MSEKAFAVNGKVQGVADKTGPAGSGQDERKLLVVFELTWGTGKPAGNMSIGFTSGSEKDHAAECARWPVGTPVRVNIERK